jgi:hypothetical protein
VAPANRLLDKKYPKGTIDMLDRFAATKVFETRGGLKKMNDFCADQETLNFTVPI